jgi:hypothetical protein
LTSRQHQLPRSEPDGQPIESSHLEHILQQLHDSEINAGVQTFYDAGMRVWIGDEANGIQAEATINRTAAARLKWPEGITAASWLHETAMRLFPDSPYVKAHND